MAKSKTRIIQSPCVHKEHRVPINKKMAKQHAQITDIKKSYPIMRELQEYTGWIQIGYDEKNNSLDIHFKRSDFEWDDGAGIQINKLTNDDKQALRDYLVYGK